MIDKPSGQQLKYRHNNRITPTLMRHPLPVRAIGWGERSPRLPLCEGDS